MNADLKARRASLLLCVAFAAGINVELLRAELAEMRLKLTRTS